MNIEDVSLELFVGEEKNTASFVFDEESIAFLFQDIFKEVALDNWENFLRLCDLPLSWYGDYVLKTTYDLDKDGADNITLSDTSYMFPTFLHAASHYFPDKYVNHIANIMTHEDNKSSWENVGSNKYTRKYLIKNLLKRNLNESLNTLITAKFISKGDCLETYIDNYKYLRDKAQILIKDENIRNILVGNASKKIPSYIKDNMLLNNINDNHKLFILDMCQVCMNNKEDFIDAVLPSIISSYNKKDALIIIEQLLINNYIELHSSYIYSEKRLAREEDFSNNMNYKLQSIENLFNIDKKTIESIYQKRANNLLIFLEENKKTNEVKKIRKL